MVSSGEWVCMVEAQKSKIPGTRVGWRLEEGVLALVKVRMGGVEMVGLELGGSGMNGLVVFWLIMCQMEPASPAAPRMANQMSEDGVGPMVQPRKVTPDSNRVTAMVCCAIPLRTDRSTIWMHRSQKAGDSFSLTLVEVPVPLLEVADVCLLLLSRLFCQTVDTQLKRDEAETKMYWFWLWV